MIKQKGSQIKDLQQVLVYFYHKPYGRQGDILHSKKFSISKIAFLACFCLVEMTKMSNFLVIFRKLG